MGSRLCTFLRHYYVNNMYIAHVKKTKKAHRCKAFEDSLPLV